MCLRRAPTDAGLSGGLVCDSAGILLRPLDAQGYWVRLRQHWLGGCRPRYRRRLYAFLNCAPISMGRMCRLKFVAASTSLSGHRM